MKRKPKLGQNFLIDEHAARRIADAFGDVSKETVVEIGPGHGAITGFLAASAKRLVCVELDHALAAQLRFRYRNHANVEIVEADILTVNLSALRRGAELLRVVGNLPYYITSDILLHLCTHASAIDTAVVMMQREVADRVAAAPGTRDYGVLSVSVQLHAGVSPLLTLPPEAFRPPPEVFSTVLRLHMRDKAAALGLSRDDTVFLRFIRIAFAQKRKTLGNNLRAAGYPGTQVEQACIAAGVATGIRAEAISLQRFVQLYKALQGSDSHAAENLSRI